MTSAQSAASGIESDLEARPPWPWPPSWSPRAGRRRRRLLTRERLARGRGPVSRSRGSPPCGPGSARGQRPSGSRALPCRGSLLALVVIGGRGVVQAEGLSLGRATRPVRWTSKADPEGRELILEVVDGRRRARRATTVTSPSRKSMTAAPACGHGLPARPAVRSPRCARWPAAARARPPARGEVLDLHHVHELVELRPRSARAAPTPASTTMVRRLKRSVVVGRCHSQRVDVEASPREQARDPAQHAGLVLDQDRQDVVADRRAARCRPRNGSGDIRHPPAGSGGP